MTAAETKNLVQGTDAWLAARSGRVTASVVASLFGKNPFANQSDAAKILRGENTFRGNLATTWGSTMEDVARDDYIELMQVAVQETGFWQWKALAGGSPDGLVQVERTGRPIDLGVLEIKCPNSTKVGKKLKSTAHYMFQCQMNMIVTKRPWCHFVTFTPLMLRVERVPAANKVRVGDLGLSRNALQEFTAHGIFNPATGTWPGYADVLYVVIESFHANATADTRDRVSWDDWHFSKYEAIAMINGLHDAMFEQGHVKMLKEQRKKLPVDAKALPAKTSWVALMLWQLDNLARGPQPTRSEKDTFHRFARVRVELTPDGKRKQARVTHMMDVMKRPGSAWRRPPWFTFSGVCVDVLSDGRRRNDVCALSRCKKLNLHGELGVPQDISYFSFESVKQLPRHGSVVTTVFRNGEVTAYGVRVWNLDKPAMRPAKRAKLQHIAPYKVVQLTDDLHARVTDRCITLVAADSL